MKKYLLTSAATLAFCGLFTSCTHDLGYDENSAAKNYVVKTYEQAFVTAFGQPDPNQEWGFGSTSVAGVRGGTRAVPGITFPDDFSEKTDIIEPGTIQKPTINKSGATVITESQTWPNQNIDNAVIYVESGVTLTLPDWSSLQHTKFYLSSGSTLVAQNLYLKGSTEFVNDGGTITIGTENSNANFVLDGLTGTFWNNGSMTIFGDFTESNADGCKIYNGSSGSISAKKIYLFKNNLFRNEGLITLTGEFNADQYSHKIYNSGTIITPSIILQKEVTLWNEGTIKAANDGRANISVNNDDVKIYIGTSATLKLTSLKLTNNRELVYNEGQLNVEGAIETYNNSEIVNYGTLAGGSLDMKSGAKFYNVAGGNVNISGLTKLNNDSGYNLWQNSGQYNTGSFEITGGCQDPAAFNNCHMSVTNKFFMNHGNFVLDGGGAVECGSFEWQSDNFFHMGGKALLKVTGQMLMNNQNSSPNYGFWGDDSEYAVIKAGSVEKGSEGKYRAAYYGNLFIDTNDHFGQGRSSADGPWYYFANTVKFSFNDKNNHEEGAKKATDFSITIPADPDGCTPGYGDEPGPDPDAIRVICEDLSVTQASDWDFNDVVFDVKLVENNSKVQITLRAAGGTLLLTVAGKEVHEAFKEKNPTYNITSGTMVSTGTTNSKGKYHYIGLKAPVFTIENNFGTTSVKEIAKNIPVQVYKSVNGESKWFDIEWKKGDPSARIGVGTDYNWCDERVDIRDNFRAHVRGTSNDTAATFTLYVAGGLEDDWYTVTEVE